MSYWSRFVFSEDYLKKVNPNLALNIYTAVSNPITNEGRVKIAKGALAHRDLRGALAPDFVATSTAIKANNGQIEKVTMNIYKPRGLFCIIQCMYVCMHVVVPSADTSGDVAVH